MSADKELRKINRAKGGKRLVAQMRRSRTAWTARKPLLLTWATYANIE